MAQNEGKTDTNTILGCC